MSKGKARYVVPARRGWSTDYHRPRKIFVKKFLVKKCPVCKNHLVKKTGLYAKFFGCSGYPKCKYTCRLDDRYES